MERKLREVDKREDKVLAIARTLSALGNPIRLRMVRLLDAKGQASWSEIEKSLEGEIGRQNPNTVNFHLSKLVIDGVIQRSESNQYSLDTKARKSEVVRTILTEVK